MEIRFDFNYRSVGRHNGSSMNSYGMLVQKTFVDMFDKHAAPSLVNKLHGDSRLWRSKSIACNTPCFAISRITTSTACLPTISTHSKSTENNPATSRRCDSLIDRVGLSFARLCFEFRSVCNTFTEMIPDKQPSRVNKISAHGFYKRIQLFLLCKNSKKISS